MRLKTCENFNLIKNLRCSRDADQKILNGEGIVGVVDEVLCREWVCLLELGGDEHGDGAEQLQLALAHTDRRQEAVHEVDCQREDSRITRLFTAHLRDNNISVLFI